MKKVRRFIFLCIIVFAILPCAIVVLFQKNVNLLMFGTEMTERYLPGILYDVVRPEMHMETLKAQAVLIRSNVIKALNEGTITSEDIRKAYSLAERKVQKQNVEFYKRLVRACQETEGEVVCFEKEISYCPYFYVSNGTTRDAFSYFKNGKYPYLVSAPSHKDETCKSYITYHHYSMEDFSDKMNYLCKNTYKNQIQILETDMAGYITWLKIGDSIVGGEIFRSALNLPSSCFTIEQKGKGVRIICRGEGHGFGFSQYGADAMAAEKKDYKELIEYYFHNITIENVYRNS